MPGSSLVQAWWPGVGAEFVRRGRIWGIIFALLGLLEIALILGPGYRVATDFGHGGRVFDHWHCAIHATWASG